MTINKDTFKRNYSMQTVHRAVKILRAFSRENKRLTLTEMHRITGLGKSSLQRLLSTLTMEGLLQKNEEDKRYQLGLEFLFLAQLVEKSSSIVSYAQPVMERINEETTESVSLHIIENNESKCIQHIESDHELTALTHIGQTSPLYVGASAKVLLAFSDGIVDRYIREKQLFPVTENTITDREKLKEDIMNIRRNGYAISNGERIQGAISISAPVFDPFGKIFASLSTVIPSARMDDKKMEEFIEIIVSGAKEITENMKRS